MAHACTQGPGSGLSARAPIHNQNIRIYPQTWLGWLGSNWPPYRAAASLASLRRHCLELRFQAGHLVLPAHRDTQQTRPRQGARLPSGVRCGLELLSAVPVHRSPPHSLPPQTIKKNEPVLRRRPSALSSHQACASSIHPSSLTPPGPPHKLQTAWYMPSSV